MKKFRFYILLFFISISLQGWSQMGVTSYSIFALGINTSQSHRISGELKMFTNRAVEDLLFELDGFFNFKPKEYHRFSIGVGMNIGPFTESDIVYAITVPLSIEIFPLKELKKVSLLFELAPEIHTEADVNVRFLWGIRYSFGE